MFNVQSDQHPPALDFRIYPTDGIPNSNNNGLNDLNLDTKSFKPFALAILLSYFLAGIGTPGSLVFSS